MSVSKGEDSNTAVKCLHSGVVQTEHPAVSLSPRLSGEKKYLICKYVCTVYRPGRTFHGTFVGRHSFVPFYPDDAQTKTTPGGQSSALEGCYKLGIVCVQ